MTLTTLTLYQSSSWLFKACPSRPALEGLPPSLVQLMHNRLFYIKNLLVRLWRTVIGIYSGKITSWKDIGGRDKKIYVANREKGDSSRIILEEHVKGFKDIQALAGKVIYTTPETADTIAEYEATIGYVPLSIALDKHLTVMKVDGISPSGENVQNGIYKYAAPFGIVWKGKPAAPANVFLEYLFTPAARKLIILNGAVPARGR